MNDSNIIGAILGTERTSLSLTTGRVCDGLCSASTYSRYESGKMLPDKFMLSALLERMGKNSDRILYTVTDEEQEILDIKKKILESIDSSDTKKAEQYLKEYSDIQKTRSKNIHKQFELEVQGELCRLNGETDKMISFYRQALEQTCKKKVGDIVRGSLFTVREFNLLFKIAKTMDYDLLFKLGFFLEKLYDNHYLKVVFYGDLVADLVFRSQDRWMKQMQLEYIENALKYKKSIKQNRGIGRLLELKEQCSGELSSEEKILLKMDGLLNF